MRGALRATAGAVMLTRVEKDLVVGLREKRLKVLLHEPSFRAALALKVTQERRKVLAARL